MDFVEKPYLAEVKVTPHPTKIDTNRNAKLALGMSVHDKWSFFWPNKCCCCNGTKDLGKTAVSRRVSLGTNRTERTLVGVPCCMQCKMHIGSSTAARIWAIGLFVVFALFGNLATKIGVAAEPVNYGFLLLALLLTLIGVGLMLLKFRHARKMDERRRNAITAECAGGQNEPVAFGDSSFTFLFCNSRYAQEFAALNGTSAKTLPVQH